MSILHPDYAFWSNQRERLLGEAILNQRGREFSLKELANKLAALTEEGPESSFYKVMVRYRENFDFTNGRGFDI